MAGGSLEARLDAALSPLLHGFSGRCGLALHRFADGVRFERDAGDSRAAASLIKLPILTAALAAAERGEVALASRHALRDHEKAGGHGILKRLEGGLSLSFRDLLTLMITLSDNTATNLVLERLGRDAVNEHIRSLGLGATRLVGFLQRPEAEWTPEQRRGERNATSPRDVLALLVALEEGRLLSPAGTRFALETLRAQVYTEALARHLPTPGSGDGAAAGPAGVSVASKSGCLEGVWHDAGIVYRRERGTERPWWALVVMTTDSVDRGFGWEQEGMMLIARTARVVYDLLLEDEVVEGTRSEREDGVAG